MGSGVGFIGAGNMGGAILKGILASEFVSAHEVIVYDINKERMEYFKENSGVLLADSSSEVVTHSEIIVLAVKPNAIEDVLKECAESFDGNKLFISIAVGIPINFYKNILGDNKKIVRAMPNTPALVGEGMTLISYDDNVTKEDIVKVMNLFACIGKVELLKEDLMTEVTALTGSSPAYVCMFIEAMADAAVLAGIPRSLSYKLAAQAVLGSARMVLETGKHPGELKDMVCSPAGTTIEAVSILEKEGFRNSVIQAMNACARRAREIGREVAENI